MLDALPHLAVHLLIPQPDFPLRIPGIEPSPGDVLKTFQSYTHTSTSTGTISFQHMHAFLYIQGH